MEISNGDIYGLDKTNADVSSETSTGVKQSKYHQLLHLLSVRKAHVLGVFLSLLKYLLL